MLKKYIYITLIAAVINSIIYFIFSSSNIITDIITPSGQPVTVIGVVASTIIGGLLAYLLYLLITKVFKVKSPQTFRIIGYILLAISFINPFAIEGASLAMIVVLNIMHIVIAVPWIEASAKQLYMAEPVHE